MVKVVENNGCFGIIDNDIESVPFVHYSKESAIEEWVYFEKLNITEEQFLDHVRTQEEIDNIETELGLASVVLLKPKTPGTKGWS